MIFLAEVYARADLGLGFALAAYALGFIFSALDFPFGSFNGGTYGGFFF